MRQVNAHFLVAQTAREMAFEVYAQCMRDNELFALWKAKCRKLTPRLAEQRFVKLLTPKLLEEARSTLAGMLATSLDENLKDTIADALIKDAALRRGRKQRTHMGQLV